MRQHILLFALAALAGASFGSDHLHSRGIVPRSPPGSKPASPRTQASTPSLMGTPQTSARNSPSRPRPNSPARAEGILRGPGLTVLNSHPAQNPDFARIYPDIRYMHTKGSPSAMVTTSSNAGSTASASGRHRVVVSVRNGPNTETCVNCVSPGGPQFAYLGHGSEANLQFDNTQPAKGPVGVTAQQFSPGAVTALGLSRPEGSGT